MWDALKRWWRYVGTKFGMRLEERADPKVQLEQAIREARAQHRRLIEQATNVIANQKQTERQLERTIDEYERANASARQALVLSDEQVRAGNNEKAKAAVAQNSTALQKKLAERQQLLSQLDQARMQEEMNKAMGQLSESVSEDVPTFDEVRAKIEKRLARAQAATEIGGASVETKMLEVEQAQMSAEAQARLGSLRAELGLRAPPMLNAPGDS